MLTKFFVEKLLKFSSPEYLIIILFIGGINYKIVATAEIDPLWIKAYSNIYCKDIAKEEDINYMKEYLIKKIFLVIFVFYKSLFIYNFLFMKKIVAKLQAIETISLLRYLF